MRKYLFKLRLLACGAALTAFTGCVSGPQLTDFLRTEVARITADIVGRLVSLSLEGAAGALAAS